MFDVTWDVPVEVASAEAHRGEWKMNDSDYRWVDDPTVALAGDVAGVAWVDQRKKDLFFQRFGAKPIGQPVNVSNSPATFSWLPRLVMRGNEVALLWQEIVFSGGTHGGEIHFARSTDGGVTFAPVLNLSNSKAGDGKGRRSEKVWDNGSLDLLREGDRLFAAWTEYEGPLWLRRSGDGGKTWSAAVRIADDARGPSIAVHKDTVHVAWSVTGTRIYIATSRDGGNKFEAPRALFEGDAPKIAVDGKGNVHLAYATEREVRYSTDLKTSRRIDRAKVRAGFPAVRIDGSDRVYVLYEDFFALDEHPRGLSLATSVDDFATVAAVPHISAPALGYNGSQQGLLTSKLAVSPTGSIAIVNSTFKANDRSRVWLLRSR